MVSRFGGEAVPTRGRSDPEPEQKIGRRPLYVDCRGVRMVSRFGGEAVPTRGRSDPEPEQKIGRRPSLATPWRIEGLLSLHVQGRRQE